MDNGLERRVGFDSFIECTLLGDVFNNGKVQLILGSSLMSISDRLSLSLRSNGRYNGMALF